MDGDTGEVSLDELTEADVEAIVTWRYGGEYAVYDSGERDRAVMLEPANRFLAIRERDRLIGHVCLGVEARVAGMTEDPAVLDLGVGLRPDRTGRGDSRRLMPALLGELERRLGPVSFRAVIKEWNVRAQRAAEHAGFAPSGRHHNEAGGWIVFKRPAREL